MFVLQFCNRRVGFKVQRAKINFLRAIIRFVQQRQALRATNQRARFLDRTAIINKQRARDRFAFGFARLDFDGLLSDARLRGFGQRLNRFGQHRRFDGEDGQMMMTTAATSRATLQMRLVAFVQLRR